MRPDESFIGQPIRSLQTMLRVLAENDSSYPKLIPDGIYGPETASAVSLFQRRHGIPVTGITDLPTWEAVVAAYEPALVDIALPQHLTVILEPGQKVAAGNEHVIVPLCQGILSVLSKVYGSVSQPGNGAAMDAATADSLASFQALSGLSPSGELDRMTWKHLSLHYPLAGCDHRKKPDLHGEYLPPDELPEAAI